MNRCNAHLLVVAIVLSLLPFPDATASSGTADFAPLDAILERAAEALGGCALVLVHDGETVYAKGFGDVGPDDSIAVASAAKWIS